jgi:hypothetical protein
MLKPAEPVEQAPRSERPVGELLHQLVDEGKAYAMAELGVVKAIAASKGKALALPAGLFGAAFLLVLAAVMGLALGVFFELYRVLDPLVAGLIAFLIFGALAGGLGWYGYQRLRRDF